MMLRCSVSRSRALEGGVLAKVKGYIINNSVAMGYTVQPTIKMATNVLPSLELSVGNVGRGGAAFARGREKSPGRSPRSKPASTPTRSRGSGSVGVKGGGGTVVRGGGGTVVRRGVKQGAQEREKTSLLKEIDPASYRHSVFHTACTTLLEKGFHHSFSELFTLAEHQRAEHRRAGPAAVLLEPLIERDPTKLDRLSQQMAAAEEAERAGDVEAVYMAQRGLAQLCEQSGDTWLSDHFYHRCLETSLQVRGDHRRKEGEAHCHVGLALENRGNLHKAAGHLETFYQLTRKHKWHTASGDSLHEIACEHLRRIYTGIAGEVHSESPTSAISYLKKALEMAKEGGDSYQEGLACHRLGNAHEGIGDPDTAIQYHKSFLERCRYHGDDAGVGSAYEALARSHESKGDIENAVKFLEMFVNVTEKAGLKDSLARACSATGSMFNTLGDYGKAVEYFGRCYELCLELDDTEALHSARVQFGIAKGHQFMDSVSRSINDPSSESLQALVGWKDCRAVHGSSETKGDEGNSNEGSSSSVEQPHSSDVDTVENEDDGKGSEGEKSQSGSQTEVIARTEIGD